MRKIITFFVLIVIFSALFGQRVLVDDVPIACHSAGTWNALWNLLRSNGATVEFTTDVGRFPDLSGYDELILMDGNASFYPYDIRTQIIDFVCEGGDLLLWPNAVCGGSTAEGMNAILTDPRWNTGLHIGPGKTSGTFSDIIPYPPFTDGVDFLYFGSAYRVYAWEPAYYVVIGVSAMSNPERLDGVECPCENGGRIFVLGDNHQFEVPVVGYFDTNDHRYMANVVLGLAGILDVPDCSHPQVPEVINIPCGDPGDYAVAYGSGFLAVDSVVIPGDGPVPFTVIDDSTMEIFIPDSFTGVQTYFQIRLYYLSNYVSATVRVYCVWLSANFEPYCLNPGDTLYFTGSAFDAGISSITINGEPVDSFGGSFGATSDSAGWLYLPTTPPGGPRYTLTLTLSDTRSITRGFRMPCPACIDVSPPFTIELEDVWFWEETTGTGIVHILYNLNATNPVNVVVEASSDGGITWDVPISSVSGAVGDDVSPGDSLEIIWDALTDFPDYESRDFIFRISVVESASTGTPSFYLNLGTAVGNIGAIQLGRIAAWRDVTGDGVGDLVAGAPGGNEVFVFSGADLLGDSLRTGDAVATITGESPGDSFGVALACGDFNGDGVGDIAVGAKNAGTGGKVYIFYGPVSGMLLAGSDASAIIADSRSAEYFGAYIAAGDLNGDGNDEFLVGAYGSDIAGTNSGRIFGWNGGGTLSGAVDADSADFTFDPDAAFRMIGEYLYIGEDITGDGLPDIALPSLNHNRVYIIPGNSFSGHIAITSVDTVLVLAEGTADNFGRSVVFCDVDGIPPADVVIGAPTNNGAGTEAGAVYVFESGHLLSVGDSVNAGSADVILRGSAPYAHFGWAVGCVDNGDPFLDIAVAEQGYSSDNGRILFFSGTDSIADSLSCFGEIDGVSSQYLAEIISCVGDINSDGIYDFLVGIPFSDDEALDGGKVWLLSLNSICPFGDVYDMVSSSPGPLDTWFPRIDSVSCPPDGEVGQSVTINWATHDGFDPPNSVTPHLPVSLWWSADGDSFQMIAFSPQSSGSFVWTYPPELTTNGVFMLCVVDSFGFVSCDTCEPITITGDTVLPRGMVAVDTCSPDSVVFHISDNRGIDWSSFRIFFAGTLYTYPDYMHLADDTTLIFEIGDLLPEPDATHPIGFSASVCDSFGNCLPELDATFRHPCCYPFVAELLCPGEETFSISACAEQTITFEITDPTDSLYPTGLGIDTTKIFGRIIVNADTVVFTPESSFVQILSDSADADITIMIQKFWEDGDTIWFMLDSVFSHGNCKTSW